MEYAIEVRNLTKRYKGFTLDDISFALPRGTVMGLIGGTEPGNQRLSTQSSASQTANPVSRQYWGWT